MRIAVVSCHAYRDTWKPFFALFRKFWPDCQYPIHLVADSIEEDDLHIRYGDGLFGVQPFPTGTANWCKSFSIFAEEYGDQPVLMMQDDFFLTRPVNTELVEQGLSLLKGNVGAVRLYPCPGADVNSGDDHFGFVDRATRYRISCQASIWNPQFVRSIAENCWEGHAWYFERYGGPWAAEHSPLEVMAFRREVDPWPMEYLCTAIARGKWDPDAKRLCDLHGIEVDWSRGFTRAA